MADTLEQAMGSDLHVAVMAAAEELLSKVAEGRAEVSALERAMAADLEEVKARWQARIAAEKNILESHEKHLKKLAKRRKDVFFRGADKCRLPSGSLLWKRIERVVRSRKVTPEALEAAGCADGVRIAKSVNWDALDKWTDERLALVGAERKIREDVAIEV